MECGSVGGTTRRSCGKCGKVGCVPSNQKRAGTPPPSTVMMIEGLQDSSGYFATDDLAPHFATDANTSADSAPSTFCSPVPNRPTAQPP